MLKTAARILLLRVLPRRLLPIVTIAEAILLVRSVRKRSKTKATTPSQSHTGSARIVAETPAKPKS